VDADGYSGKRLPEVAKNPTFTKDFFLIDFDENPSPTDQQAAEEYDELTRAFSPVMGTSRETGDANWGFSAASGSSFQVGGDDVIGVLGALTYTRKNSLYLGGQNNQGAVTTASGPLVLKVPREDSSGTEEVLMGGLATLLWEPEPNHDLALKVIANHGAEDQSRFQFDAQSNENQALTYTERDLLSTQLHGNHLFPNAVPGPFGDLVFNWNYAYNATQQREPDVRFFRNGASLIDTDGDGEVDAKISREPGNSTPRAVTRRIYRNLEEINNQGALNVTLPFKQWSSLPGDVKLGFYAENSDRDFVQRSFFYRFPQRGRFARGATLDERRAVSCNQRKQTYLSSDLDSLWTDRFGYSDRTGLSPEEVYCDTDDSLGRFPNPSPNQLLWTLVPDNEEDVSYDGGQTIVSYYGMAELPLLPKLTFIGGLRHERTEIDIQPMGAVNVVVVLDSGARTTRRASPEEAAAALTDHANLPALSLQWEPLPNMLVRGAWSKTLARPTFRELAPVVNEEFIFGDEYLGNSELVLSKITNYDLRWEWFRRPGEVLAFSLFKKEIRNPIELISFTLASEEERTIVTPINFEEGKVDGWEAEARTALDVISQKLRWLSIGANYARLESSVAVPDEEYTRLETAGLQQERRPLQGQPEYVLNANLTYSNPRSGTTAAVFYNKIGETLVSGAAIGFDGTPNVIELDNTLLDFSLRQRIMRFERGGTEMSVVFKAKNLTRDDRTQVFRLPFARFDSEGEMLPLEEIKIDRATARRLQVAFNYAF
jgi:TonB-dependent receptor